MLIVNKTIQDSAPPKPIGNGVKDQIYGGCQLNEQASQPQFTDLFLARNTCDINRGVDLHPESDGQSTMLLEVVGIVVGLWVKDRYPTWNPGKWNQRLKPAVPWWTNFNPHP